MFGWMNEQIVGSIDGWMNEQINGVKYEWTSMDGWVDGHGLFEWPDR